MISCILPTHRGGFFVTDRLAEIQNSTYSDLEVILIEDGVVNEYEIPEKLKNKIKIIKLKNNSKSVSIPRAIGISHSSGEFICHVDDDVIIFPNKFKLLIDTIADSSLCYGNRIEVYLPNTKKNSSNNIINSNPIKLKNWNPFIQSGVDGGQFMYRSEVWRNRRFIFPKRACDWETAKEVCLWNNKISYIDETLCGYIWHETNRNLDPNSITNPIYPDQFLQYFNKNSNFLGV